MFASKMESSHYPLRIYDFFMIFGNHLLPQIRLKREEEENSWKKKKVGATVDLSPEQLATGLLPPEQLAAGPLPPKQLAAGCYFCKIFKPGGIFAI